MNTRRSPWAFLAFACLTSAAAAAAPTSEAAAPPPPAKYDVVVRYDIDAFRNQRVAQFRDMVDLLRRFGFAKGEGPEDEAENRAVNRMSGTIASADARKLLLERHVRAVRLQPAGSDVPKGDATVRVQLELNGILTPEPGRFLYGLDAVRRMESEDGPALERQRLLADQARGVLAKLGFREAAGYDTRAFSRLVGTVPASKLDLLLDDLRTQANGADLPAPFATRWPLLVVEVMPDLPLPKPPAEPAAAPKGQEKLTPEVRALLGGADADKPQRMEVILWLAPRDADVSWQNELLRAAPGVVLEGRLGPLVSVVAPPSQAVALAASPAVSTVRLPRSAQARPFGANGEKIAPEALGGKGLEHLRDVARRGNGVRIALIDGDFRGWQALAGKGLLKATSLFDLTAERNAGLLPDPVPGGAAAVGHGTQLAEALTKVAPGAELLLIRVDPAAPYQLLTVARALSGDAPQSLNLDRRNADLDAERDLLAARHARLLEERRAALEGVGEADDLEKLRQTYRANQAKLDQDEREFQARLSRYVALEESLRALRKVKTVVCGLAWNEGLPADGGGALARYFDDRPLKPYPWLQAAPDVRGQAWVGPFHDPGRGGLLAFRPPSDELPAGLWSPTLAFLNWEPAGGKAVADLPAGARLRVAVQWREAHDAEFLRRGEDVYREPLTPLDVVVLRQSDPSGVKQPADDFEVVAASSGLPQRLDNELHSSVYEQAVDVVVKQAGRYALQVRGRRPDGTRPAGVPTLPIQRQTWDLRPRLFVETFDGPGRAVYRDFATAEGSVGTPGDARRTDVVGPASGRVPVFGVGLGVK